LFLIQSNFCLGLNLFALYRIIKSLLNFIHLFQSFLIRVILILVKRFIFYILWWLWLLWFFFFFIIVIITLKTIFRFLVIIQGFVLQIFIFLTKFNRFIVFQVFGTTFHNRSWPFFTTLTVNHLIFFINLHFFSLLLLLLSGEFNPRILCKPVFWLS
jgi:hypothetical protein